jgi:hypothetical protein
VADVLKDCCSVLGAAHCLSRAVAALETEVPALCAAAASASASSGSGSGGGGGGGGGSAGGGGGGEASWTMAEACLFAARSVSSGVSPHEGEVVPRLMALVARLPPSSPHLRYTANLVVGRYRCVSVCESVFLGV